MKVEKADNNAEASEMVQFAYINDTLLRVYYFTRDSRSKKHILAILYLAGDSVIASEVKGNLPVPDINILKQKSDLYRTQGQEIIDSRNGFIKRGSRTSPA